MLLPLDGSAVKQMTPEKAYLSSKTLFHRRNFIQATNL